jgi:hypothetical protein
VVKLVVKPVLEEENLERQAQRTQRMAGIAGIFVRFKSGFRVFR